MLNHTTHSTTIDNEKGAYYSGESFFDYKSVATCGNSPITSGGYARNDLGGRSLLARNETDKRIRRINTTAKIITGLAILLVIRYATIMLSSTSSFTAVQEGTQRGAILDRTGRVLAIQTQLDTVTAWLPSVSDIGTTSRLLGDILEQTPSRIENLLSAGDGYVIVQRLITPSQSTRIRQLIDDEKLTGIQLERDAGRTYPEREAAAAIIGYTGVDDIGLGGIEYVYNDTLSPPDGEGSTVYLTLDLGIQGASDQLAQRLLSTHQADSVTIIVGEAKTGKILAASSLPSFDPNHFRRYTDAQRRNRVISEIYEPGSVLKVFTVAGFLDVGAITPADRFETSGGYTYASGELVIADLANYGRITPQEIIKFSSNVGAARASQRIEAGAFYAMLTRFGFGRRTGIDLNGEEHGLLSPPERWSGRSKATLSIGQEIGVTAIQMFAAATVLANDGVLLRPQIVEKVISPTNQELYVAKREPVREVLSATTARTMRSFMKSATEPDSTARRIQIDGVPVAAKTGTAEVFDRERGGYSANHFIASTLSLIPADDPELIVYLKIDFPREGEYYGGRIAAPATDELLEFLVPYVDIPRSFDQTITHNGTIVQRERPLPPLRNTVPDYRGFAARTLLPLLGVEEISVTITGSGRVVRQTPPPGTQLTRGMTLTLELE